MVGSTRFRRGLAVKRCGLMCVVMAAMVVGMSLSGVAPAGAARGRSPVAETMRPAALPGATRIGRTPASTPIRVSLVLRVRHLTRLERQVSAGAFHRGSFLSVEQFARTYGQSRHVVRLISRYLRSYGMRTRQLADRVSILATGTAHDIDRAFGITLSSYRLPATPASRQAPGRPAQVVHGTNQDATLPSELAGSVMAVAGLMNYRGAYVSSAMSSGRSPERSGRPGVSGIPEGYLTPESFLRLYKGMRLESLGSGGAGRSVGIVTLASLRRADALTFWRALGVPSFSRRLRLVNVDGGSGPPSLNADSPETALDVEQAGAIAPHATVVVYQAPNSDQGLLDGFLAAVSSDRAGSISTSWIMSETYLRAIVALGQESPAYEHAFNVPLLEAAAQGQSAFGVSGDYGAYGARPDIGSTNLTVDFPSSSPYITTTGGTTLSAKQYPQRFVLPSGGIMTVVVPRQRTWGWDYLWPEYHEFGSIYGLPHLTEKIWAENYNVVGSGGGSSSLFAMPQYQRGFRATTASRAIRYLKPTAFTSTFPALGEPLPYRLPSDWISHFAARVKAGTTTTSHRLVPDFSANADPDTGYAIYSSLFQQPYGTPWLQYGGTSFVAPQMAAVAALIQDADHGRLGFWNPAIYRFAASSPSPFTPLDFGGSIAETVVHRSGSSITYTVPGNDNIFYAGSRGSPYNIGSGLGYPDLTQLALAFGK
jgi:kumamolisin